MKAAILPSLILGFVLKMHASEIHREVERSSKLEQELAYKLSVQDKHDDWRSQGLEKVFPIKGPAPEYLVRFDATTDGKLKEFFGLGLTLMDESGVLVSVPLETQSKFSEKVAQLEAKAFGLEGDAAVVRRVSVQFLIKKELITRAVLKIRCGSGLAEESYSVRLADYTPGSKPR